jgi:hypothetical protein
VWGGAVELPRLHGALAGRVFTGGMDQPADLLELILDTLHDNHVSPGVEKVGYEKDRTWQHTLGLKGVIGGGGGGRGGIGGGMGPTEHSKALSGPKWTAWLHANCGRGGATCAAHEIFALPRSNVGSCGCKVAMPTERARGGARRSTAPSRRGTTFIYQYW